MTDEIGKVIPADRKIVASLLRPGGRRKARSIPAGAMAFQQASGEILQPGMDLEDPETSRSGWFAGIVKGEEGAYTIELRGWGTGVTRRRTISQPVRRGKDLLERLQVRAPTPA